MPVILKAEGYETWLHGSTVEAQELLKPFPAQEMREARRGENLWFDPQRSSQEIG